MSPRVLVTIPTHRCSLGLHFLVGILRSRRLVQTMATRWRSCRESTMVRRHRHALVSEGHRIMSPFSLLHISILHVRFSVFCSLLGLLFFSEFLFSVRRFLGLYYRYGTSISESIYVINWVKLDYLVYGMDFGLHQGRRTSGPVGSLRYHYVVHPGVSLLFSSGVSSPCHIFGRRLKPCCFCLFP